MDQYSDAHMGYYYDLNVLSTQCSRSFSNTVLFGLYPNGNFASAVIDSLPILLQGVAEAGLFPGVCYYLTLWYIRKDTAFRLGIYFASGVLAGEISGFLLSITHSRLFFKSKFLRDSDDVDGETSQNSLIF